MGILDHRSSSDDFDSDSDSEDGLDSLSAVSSSYLTGFSSYSSSEMSSTYIGFSSEYL